MGPYYPFYPSQGSILSNALVCELAWSNAIPRRSGSANPSCELLPPREMLFMLHHPFAHNPHISTWVHTIHSIQVKGPYYMHSYASWRGAMPFPTETVQPTRRAQPREPTSIMRVLTCVREADLYSTRGILTLDSRSQGKRRSAEEKAHSHQNRVIFLVTPRVHMRNLVGWQGRMWVKILLISSKFFSVWSEKVAIR